MIMGASRGSTPTLPRRLSGIAAPFLDVKNPSAIAAHIYNDSTTLFDLWAVAAVTVVLYVVKWRLDPFHRIPTVGGPSLPLLSYLGAWRFMNNSKALVREGYRKHYGSVFKIAMWDRWIVFVSGREMIDDLRRRPDEELSLTDAVEDSMQLRQIVGHESQDNPYHVSIIRDKLTRSLPAILPDVVDEISLAVKEHIPAAGDEWLEVDIVRAMQHITARASSRIFVGLPLCRNQEYLDLAVNFTIDLNEDSKLYDWIPQILKPTVSRLYSTARGTVDRSVLLLEPVIRERRAMMNKHDNSDSEWSGHPNDLLQWCIEASQVLGESDRSIAARIMLTDFAAIHTSSNSISLTLRRLVENPGSIEPLREEIESVIAEEGWTKAALGKMWKLDSLLKEFQRHDGIGLGSVMRKAKRDVTLRDGTVLPRSALVIASAYGTHHDDSIYADADVFDAFRFSRMREDDEGTKHQFVNTSVDYIPFGLGKHACPGRFFAATELKTVLAHILLEYDLKLCDESSSWSTQYRGLAIVPMSNAKILFRKRQGKE